MFVLWEQYILLLQYKNRKKIFCFFYLKCFLLLFCCCYCVPSGSYCIVWLYMSLAWELRTNCKPRTLTKLNFFIESYFSAVLSGNWVWLYSTYSIKVCWKCILHHIFYYTWFEQACEPKQLLSDIFIHLLCCFLLLLNLNSTKQLGD